MTPVRTRRLVPSLLALGSLGAGVFAADPTVTIISPATGATGSASTVVFKVDWGVDVGGWDPLNSGYNLAVTLPAATAINNGAGYNAAATTLTVDDTTGYLPGMVFSVGSEHLKVATVASGTSLTVVRGVNGTTAAAMADNDVVTPISSWVVGDMAVYEALSTTRLATPVDYVNYNADSTTVVSTDGVVRTVLTTANVDTSTNDRAPSARSTVFTLTLSAGADQVYLQIPQSSAFTLSGKTASPSGSGAYNSPTLLYQKLPASPVYSYLDVSTPVSTVGYDGSLSATPTVTFSINVDDNEAAAPATATTTLGAAITTTTDTTVTVASSASFTANSSVIQVGSEQMLVTTVTDGTHVVVTRGYNGTTAATALNAANVFATASLINPKVGSGLSWTVNIKDTTNANAIVGTKTFTKKGTVGNQSNNTLGRQTISVPITTELAAGQHALTVEILDGAGQTVAITGAGTDAPTGNVVVWDAPTLVANGQPMTVGSTTQVQRSNDLIFTGSRFNNTVQSHKSVVSLKIDGGLPATSSYVATTLNGTINSSVTTLVVTSATNVAVGTVLFIDTEQLLVTAVNSTTITVTRGANGTTAAGHTDGATITGTSVNTASSLSATAINVSTTISAAITTTNGTSVSVTSATGIDVGSVILVGTEKMLVTAVSGTTLTVTRGYASSTAATHLISAALTVDASNTSFRFDLTKLPVAKKHVLTLTQTYDLDDGDDADASEAQVVQTYYLDTSTTIDSVAPAIPSILTPGDGTTLTVNKPSVTGQAEPGAKIKLVATPTDGSTVITLDYPVTADATTGAFSFAASDWTTAGVSLAAGKTYSIQVQAKDSANNESTISDSAFQVTTPTDTVTPTILPNGSNVRQSTIDSAWYAKSGNIVFRLTAKNYAGTSFAALSTTDTTAGLANGAQVSTTLAAAITTVGQTTITATSATGITVGSVLTVGSEKMIASAINGAVVTVTRGAFGTTAATASNGAALTGSTGALSDFTVTTGASISDVTINAGNIDVTVYPGTATSVGLSLAAGQFTVGGYDNTAATAPTVSRDTVLPTVTAKLQPTIGTSATGINNAFQVVLTASEAIESVITAGTECTFTAAGTGISNAAPAATRQGAATFDATRKTITVNYAFGTMPTVTSGNLTINLATVPANFVADYADNKNLVVNVTGQSKVADTAGSTCVISSTATTIGKTAPINFLFTFNEAVSDFDKTKILVTNGVLQTITGSGAAYTAQVMPGEGPTAVKVEFVSGATVKDTVGNVSSDLSAAGGSGVSWLSRTYDTTSPRVVSFTSSTPAPTSTDAKPTSKTSIPCSIVFSESLATTSLLTTSAFVVDGGTISGLAGSGSAYTFNIDVTNPSTETEKKIRCVLQAGKVKDSADNTNSAVAVLVRNFDQKVPSLTFDTPTLGGSTGATATATAKFVINVDGASSFYTSGDVFLSKVDVTKLGVSTGTISSVVMKRANGSTLTDDSYPVATIEVNVSDVRRSPGSVITLSAQSGAVKDRAGNSSAATTKDLVIPGAG